MIYDKIIIAFLAITAQAIPFPRPQAGGSAQCMMSWDGEFGFRTTKGGTGSQAGDGQATSQAGDGQTQSGAATQIDDGQTQSGGAATQIDDGQTHSGAASQIDDGQVQSGGAASQIDDGQVQSGGAASQIGDGQVQSGAASQIGDGQVQSGAASQIGDGQVQSGGAATQIGDGQTQSGAAGQAGDGQVQSGGSSGGTAKSCKAGNSLSLMLKDGVLMDNKGRTGYIASNYQFQFDNPPQSGHLQVSGFSICDGKIALDGSTKWYACNSGDFYNLYSKNWAPQCEEVAFSVVEFAGNC